MLAKYTGIIPLQAMSRPAEQVRAHFFQHGRTEFGVNGYPLDARCTCDPKYRARFQSREEPFSWARVQVLRWGSVMRLGENRPVELYVRQGDTHFGVYPPWQKP